MNTTSLIKYTKTQAQENKLNQMLFSDCYTKIKSRPTLTNKNLIIRLTDNDGREFFYELTPEGNKVNTKMWF